MSAITDNTSATGKTVRVWDGLARTGDTNAEPWLLETGILDERR
jgi:hypothetical protein